MPGAPHEILGSSKCRSESGQVSDMSVAKSQQESITKGNTSFVDGKRMSAKVEIVQILGFDMGEERYGIDLKEAVDVIKDLMRIQACTTRSVTKKFIRLNRRNTIVFNLDQCLAIQNERAGSSDRKSPSFFMLNEKIADCCVGILVPGIPSFSAKEVSRGTSSSNSSSRVKNQRGCSSRPALSGNPGKTGKAVSMIDLREFVENCIVTLKYSDSIRHNLN
jgi:chemotaxis signal transduction protein